MNIKENKNSKYALKNYESLFGIILLLVGLSFIFTNNIINLIWQILILIWGILNIKDNNYLQGAILATFGSIFLLDYFLSLNITTYVIGFFFISLGAKLLFNSIKK